MSKTVKAIAGVALIAVGLVVAPQLVLVGAQLLSSALMTPSMGGRRQAQETTLTLGESPRQAIFGKAAVGGSLVDGFNYGGKYGTDWEVLVIALADHECEALEGFYVNDKYVAFGGDGIVSGYKSQLAVYWRSGTENQTVPSVLTTNGPGWTANDNGAGVAYVVVAYKADASDAKNPVWTSGRPRFLWVVKGARCYDARLDTTVGGSGPQRRDDASTWAWSDNAMVCRATYVRGLHACGRVTDPKMLLVGRGLTATEAPPANVFAPANLCDELVDGEKRYRIGGSIGADRSFGEVEELFAAACGGVIAQPEGSVEIEPGQAKAPVVTITDADLLVGSQVNYAEFRSEADREWLNTIVPRYIEPTQKWAEHAAPIRRVAADVIEDGGSREEVLSLPLVNHAAQAGRVAEIKRRLGRLQRTASLTLGPRFCELEEGDWIVWTSARYLKGASITFRIEACQIDEKWHVGLQLREINASVYSAGEFIEDQAVAEQPDAPPEIGAPDPGAWTLTAQQLTHGGAAIPALVITGATDDPYAESVRFEYWPDDGVTDPENVTNWVGSDEASPSVTRREITSIAPGAVYYAAVSYVIGGEPGERLILGPVTAGQLTPAGYTTGLISTSFVTDADPADGLLVGTDTSITIEAHTRTYDDKAVAVNGGSVTGLDPSTAEVPKLYHIYYDDLARVGGAVTFLATLDGPTAATTPANPGRHYVGSLVTAVSGGTGTSGGGASPPGWGGGIYNGQYEN